MIKHSMRKRLLERFPLPDTPFHLYFFSNTIILSLRCLQTQAPYEEYQYNTVQTHILEGTTSKLIWLL